MRHFCQFLTTLRTVKIQSCQFVKNVDEIFNVRHQKNVACVASSYGLKKQG